MDNFLSREAGRTTVKDSQDYASNMYSWINCAYILGNVHIYIPGRFTVYGSHKWLAPEKINPPCMKSLLFQAEVDHWILAKELSTPGFTHN